eukprot:Opistho-2@54599
MRIIAFAQVRDAILTHQESTAHINTLHQVKTFGLGLLGWSELDGRSIVDQHINPPKTVYRLLNGRLYLVFMTDIYLHSQCFSACGFYFLRSRKNSTTQTGVFFHTFGSDNNIGAFFGQTQGHGFTDTSAGAGNKYGSVLK